MQYSEQTPCGCSGPPRSALEHERGCPNRLTFYGGKLEWDQARMYVVIANGSYVLWQCKDQVWLPDFFGHWAKETCGQPAVVFREETSP